MSNTETWWRIHLDRWLDHQFDNPDEREEAKKIILDFLAVEGNMELIEKEVDSWSWPEVLDRAQAESKTPVKFNRDNWWQKKQGWA